MMDTTMFIVCMITYFIYLYLMYVGYKPMHYVRLFHYDSGWISHRSTQSHSTGTQCWNKECYVSHYTSVIFALCIYQRQLLFKMMFGAILLHIRDMCSRVVTWNLFKLSQKIKANVNLGSVISHTYSMTL